MQQTAANTLTYGDIAEALKCAVRSYGDRHANSDGLALPPVPGLRMIRAYAPSGAMRSMYRPLVCLVLQGAKLMTVGREERLFTGGQSLILGVDVPVIGRIVEASRDKPYLAVAIELDMTVMQSVAIEIGTAEAACPSDATLFVESLDETILNCAARLMRLIDHPEAVPVLRPAILRELHYWLLTSSHGPSLRRLCLPNSHIERITRAINFIRSDFRKPIAVDRLANTAGLSLTAFRRHFRAVTSLSPNQFQKQLRLIEARRLMLTHGHSASRAAFEVGYQSASQFSREYARMFGAPPRQDLRKGVDLLGSSRMNNTSVE
jgi:AraC-like DNA-binding protein